MRDVPYAEAVRELFTIQRTNMFDSLGGIAYEIFVPIHEVP